MLEGRRLWAVQNFSNQVTRIRLGPAPHSGVVEEVITSDLFQIPTTAARFGSRLAVVNAKFDTGFPPTAKQYEVVVVDRLSVGHANRRSDRLCIGGRGPSAVEVAAPAPAVRLGPELPLQLHQAPDPGAVGAEVGLDLGGQLADGGQVDAEQLRAPLQRRRDRPAQVRVVPSPHRTRVSNTSSRMDRERCVVRQVLGGPRWGGNSADPGRRQRSRYGTDGDG